MCDVCSDVVLLLETHDDRQHVSGGLQLNKREVMAVLLYVASWPQRQCMCCYKDFKNFERFNNIVQVILSIAIRAIQTLPEDYELELVKESQKKELAEKEKLSNGEKDKEKSHDDDGEDVIGEDEDEEFWLLEEKDRLLQFVTKVFLMNFPPYVAYKHIVHSSLEDPDVPPYLVRNVCVFWDSNGMQAMNQCFERATPETLPFTVAHTLITIIANLRLWMNIPTVMQYIIPLKTAVIRYMCKLSDKDLRMAGTRNMTDLMWAAVKEPLDTHFTFDKEGLDLAFKYFTCSTLTIRLAGITQINNQINIYNESCNNETLADAESAGNQLASWLIDSKIIEHIFGPNLHVELIKQSQVILNFLAMEWRITNEHIDCIWAASQLKHCGKQVYDILIPLIKNLELRPVQHLLKLLSKLEPAAHTESTLYLASALIKCIWNSYSVSQCPVSTIQHQPQVQAQMEAYTAIARQNEEIERAGLGKAGQHEVSSSNSSQLSEGSREDGTSRKVICRPHNMEGSGEAGMCRGRKSGVAEGGESEESNLSADSEGSAPGVGHHCGLEGAVCDQVHRDLHVVRMGRRHKHMEKERHSGSEASESEVECSESSEEIETEGDTEQESAEEPACIGAVWSRWGGARGWRGREGRRG
ncbi:ubiquitin carboxyl-terminal hydrolase 34-like [Liolophura sinensis]|uniref:ubiquitin carboxyl-terminal hydrolase 34-like n=1 Tax=Liolophura sinensis TaxID=3198878 RepID=UPI003158E1FC